MIDLAASLFRAGIDFFLKKGSAGDVERELNTQFGGKEFSISNYQDEEISLVVEAIHARPKFFERELSNGITEVEGDNLFTKLEKERGDPTFKEKLLARLSGQWITILTLKIDNGDSEKICPPGLNLGYITATTSVRYQGYEDTSRPIAPISPIRVANTHDLQSDKLEIKIQYNESMGDYAERISDSINLLQNIQDEMQYYATLYLLDLHYSGKTSNGDEFSWPDEQKARELSNFLFDQPVDLDELEQVASEIKTDFIKKL